MTDIKNHVPDLETCEMLRDAGFPQETYFHWVRRNDKWVLWDETGHSEFETGREQEWIAAPLATEIMSLFDFEIDKRISYTSFPVVSLHFVDGFFCCLYKDSIVEWSDTDPTIRNVETEIDYEDTNPATACTLMWLKLKKENKL